MTNNAIPVANHLLRLSLKRVKPITHLKLQKLLYLAYGWWLIQTRKPLTEEAPELFKFGPGFRTVFFLYRETNNKDITNILAPSWTESKYDCYYKEERHIVENLLYWVLDKYGNLSDVDLSEMCSAKKGAWYKMAEKNYFKVPPGTKIEQQYILEEFENYKNQIEGKIVL